MAAAAPQAKASANVKDSGADAGGKSIAIAGRYGTFKTSGNIARDVKDSKRKAQISKLDEAWKVLQLAVRSSDRRQYAWVAALLSTAAIRLWLMMIAARMLGRINQAIHARNRVSFERTLLRRFTICLCSLGVKEAAEFAQGRLAQVWHVGLTRTIHNRYFDSQMFYHLGRASITDADQRITVDAEETLATVATIVEKFVSVAGLGTYFTAAIYREMGAWAAACPWLFIYAMHQISNLVPLDWRRLAGLMEFQFGQYRGQHNRLVQHGEAVAALQGAEVEGARLQALLEKTEQAQRIFWNSLTTYIRAQSFCSKFAPMIISPIVVLWPFFRRSQTSTETMTAAAYQVSIFLEAMTATGTLQSSLLDLQRVGGNAARVTDLLAAFDKVDSDRADIGRAFQQSADSIEFRGVDVVTPTGHTLVEDLSFSVVKGSNLIITGHNGAGKSSIFRCLGGLWRVPKGTISKPGSGAGLHGKVFYIPQKPYNLVGTLEEQVTYPLCSTPLVEDELGKLLDIVDLKYLLGRRGEVDWERALSLGEQQRLAMVRLLYHRPEFAVLDECTSAVSADMERRFYTFCAERGITCITISHRPALQHFHDRMLALGTSKRGYRIETIAKGEQGEVRQATLTGAGALAEAPPVQTPSRSLLKHVTFIVRLLRIARPRHFELKLFGTVILASLQTAVQHGYSILMAGLYSCLLRGDAAGFRRRALGLCLWAAGSSCCRSWNRVHQCHLGTDLRMQLSRGLLARYLGDCGFYRLKGSPAGKGPSVWDPEIRLGVDVREWGLNASSFCTTFPTLVVESLWWAAVLRGVIGARYALAIYVYAALASVSLRTVIPSFRLIRETENAMAGKYRSEHASVLASAESIAFFGGGAFEREVVERRFRDLMRLKSTTAIQMSRYNFGNGLLFTLLPTHFALGLQNMLAQRVSEGAMLAAVQQNITIGIERMFDTLAALQEFVESFQKFIGSTNRLHELLDALDALPPLGANTRASDDIAFHGVDLMTPAGACLARGLELQVKRGEPLMITGPNGCGKSSFFRALGGLWPLPGTLHRPLRGLDVFLVPQKPFLTSPGTLAEQVIYPEALPETNGKTDLTDALKAQLRTHMETVGLLDLLDREGWDAQAKDNELSLGEQQRLGMARLFYHRPHFAVLDECTSAVSAEAEVGMYAHAHKLGITTITLSQRLALKEYHTRELRMGLPDAGWSLSDIAAERWRIGPPLPVPHRWGLDRAEAQQACAYEATTVNPRGPHPRIPEACRV